MIGIGIEFGRARLIRLQFFKPTVFDAEADRDADADAEKIDSLLRTQPLRLSVARAAVARMDLGDPKVR